MMRIEIGKDDSTWIDLAWTWVNKNVKAGARVFLPAGNTPLPLYRKWVEQPNAHLQTLQFIQIDDILTGSSRGVFKQFFQKEMNPFMQQFEWIDRADKAADVAILGVGVNGHVAFHEPGIARNFYSGCIPLSNETCKYLNLQEPTWGITYGAAAFLQCRKILVLARGETKKQVMKRAATDSSIPIGWIMEHFDVTLISDFEF